VPKAEWHPLGCDCPACPSYVPTDEPRLPLIRLTIAGLVAGHVCAVLVDPAGSIAIAADLLRWWLLP
jgi:hypothetical protein